VFDVGYNKDEIICAIKKQLKVGKYEPDYIYGDGGAGEKIAKIISELDLTAVSLQKKLNY